ncbi:hypothetical protein [Streptosporangium sp. NBC_01756]|uniref:hypothetical protein n=1 Tax=Streptosporangium sp. NBC_01756 TaxID=2975950 RepID=UPI002DDBB5A5|nr:hypothetical protein [Streptosporangium sp. NBC_01756]WSC85296.1 hypothetical protein OIE48_33840 [Streptosporangium sp. NBC_01756]
MTGTWPLIRLILRRDRMFLPLLLLVLAALPITQTSGIAQLYGDEAALRQFSASMNAAPAFAALYGPITHWNVAAMGVWRAGFTPVLLALVVVLTVIRHTRVEEETGRRELLGSTVLGRHAALTAALAVGGAASLFAGLIVVLSMGAYPAAGGLSTALGYAAVGLTFAAVGAVAAQLTESAGGARTIAISALGAAFVLRMAGDTTEASFLTWLSPIGWGQKMRPFADEVWWPLGLFAAVSRLRWAASHLVFILLGPAVVLTALGLTLGLAYGSTSGDAAGQLPRVLGAALAQLPAVWTFAGLAVALFGLLPRLFPMAWAALGLFLLLGQIGALLGLPPALLDLSPFSHLPRLPGGELTAAPLLTLVAIAAVLTAAGLYGLRRRDIG